MGRLLIRRVSLALLVLAFVSLMVFVMVELLPGDAATAYLGRNATPEGLERARTTLGLDRPAPERFLAWAGGLLRGDLGISLARQEPINNFLWLRLRNSLLLGLNAALVGFSLAVGLGASPASPVTGCPISGSTPGRRGVALVVDAALL